MATIIRVSTDSSGAQGNGSSKNPVFSPDGTKVAFYSEASNLVSGDTHGTGDIFVKDLATGAVTLVSADASGAPGNDFSYGSVFSPDGSKVAFYSYASNLVAGDTNAIADIFVKDLITGAVTLVSADASGAPGNDFSYGSVFSPDGSKVAFYSYASNLVAGDTNGGSDIFVKDLTTGAVTLVSADASGTQGNIGSYIPVFSPDGGKVMFFSSASNLVSGDTNGTTDIFVKDLITGAVTLVSADASGTPGNSVSYSSVFSPDGSRVAFYSSASNLVTSDTNGSGDIFVKDLTTGAVTLVSADASGTPGNGESFDYAVLPDVSPVFSPDGGKVAFYSSASNLVGGDTNGSGDIFVKDLTTGAVTLVSADASGTPGNSESDNPVFSSDGTKVAFRSAASNLVSGDTNGEVDIFVKDLTTGAVTLVSADTFGTAGNSWSYTPVFSPDGTKVMFESPASNLVSGDTNGTYDIFVVSLDNSPPPVNPPFVRAYVQGPEEVVASDLAHAQMVPAIAATADGGYVVAWQKYIDGTDIWDIVAQRYDAAGTAVGGAFTVNTTTARQQSYASVAGLDGGGFVISWMSEEASLEGFDIYAQAYDANGQPAGTETLVNTYTTDYQTLPSMAALSGGGYVIVWASNGEDGSGLGVYAQRYDATGTAVGGETQVNTTTNDAQYEPNVAALAGGGYVVTWESLFQDGSQYGIYSQRYDAAGAAVGGETQVNTHTADSQASPAVAGLTDGGYVIAWESDGQDGDGTGIYLQRYDAAGTAAGGETRVNSTTLSWQGQPSIAALPYGGFVVTWQSYGQDGDDQGVYAQRFDAAGLPDGAEIQINSTTTAGQWSAVVTALDDGSYVIAWQGSLDYGASMAVYQEHFTATSNQPPELTGTQVPLRGAWADAPFTLRASDLLQGFSDPDNDPLHVSALTTDHGTITDNGDGTFTFVNEPGYVGDVALSYDVDDDWDGTIRGYNSFTLNPYPWVRYGDAGDNLLNGSNHSYHLHGLGGDDTYIVDDAGDLILENPNEGTDTVQSSITWTLANNVENLTLTGAGNIDGTGNGLNNTIIGNGGINVLTGGLGDDILDGKGGADLLTGGAGDDIYVVDNTGDIVVEQADEGTDTVKSSLADYTLGATLENLILISTGNSNGTGNSLNNVITGNGADNTLLGGRGDDILNGGNGNDVLNGGTGFDRMNGGAGDDTYYLGSGDTIIEAADGGTDTVMSGVAYYHLGVTLENVTLYVAAALDADGNNLDNVMIGNANANILRGGGGNDTIDGGDGNDTINGGKGADLLTGGAGNDTFVFNSLADSLANAVTTWASYDRITDLSAGDVIDLHLIDADVHQSGDQAFHQVAAFTGQATEMTLVYDAGTDTTVLSVDANGDTRADFVLLLSGQHTDPTGWVL